MKTKKSMLPFTELRMLRRTALVASLVLASAAPGPIPAGVLQAQEDAKIEVASSATEVDLAHDASMLAASNEHIRDQALQVNGDGVMFEKDPEREISTFKEYDLSECASWTGVPSLEKVHNHMQNQCGVIAFLHVSKTGGMTVEQYIRDETEKRGFTTLSLSTTKSTHNKTVDWQNTDLWRYMMDEVEGPNPHPRLFLRLHNGGPGLVSYKNMLETTLMPMKAKLEQKGCGFLLVTMLREPASRSLSQMYYDNSCKDDACAVAVVQKKSNFQTRYAIDNNCGYGVNSCNRQLERKDLEAAKRALTHFDIIGRTEDFDTFTAALNKAMGWPLEQRAKSTNLTPKYFRFNVSDAGIQKFRDLNRADNEMYRSFCSAATDDSVAV